MTKPNQTTPIVPSYQDAPAQMKEAYPKLACENRILREGLEVERVLVVTLRDRLEREANEWHKRNSLLSTLSESRGRALISLNQALDAVRHDHRNDRDIYIERLRLAAEESNWPKCQQCCGTGGAEVDHGDEHTTQADPYDDPCDICLGAGRVSR